MKFLTRQEELILLTIYHLGGASSLIEIREYLIESTKKSWQISTIHAALERLEKSKYLGSEISDPIAKRGGRGVKNYSITKYGNEALTELQQINSTMWQGVTIKS